MKRSSISNLSPGVLALILSAAAALTGMLLVAYATHFGPGVGGDATIYLTSAQNLLAGSGLGWVEADGSFRLLPYAPPFYPLALAAVGWLARDFVAGARWLNVLMFGVTILILGWGLYRASGRVWLAGILAGLLATSPVLLGVQVWAMSESIFLLTGFGGLLLFLAYLETERRDWFVLSAVLLGLSLLSRYIGIAFIGAACLGLIFLARPASAARRWRAAILYGLVAILPGVIWLVIDIALTGAVGSRSGQPASAYWQRLLSFCPAVEQIYLFWLLPESLIGRLPGIVRALLWIIPTAGVGVLAAWIARRYPASQDKARLRPAVRLAVVFGLALFLYLLILAASHVFVYPPVTMASRMLSPAHLAAIVLLAVLAHLGLELLPASRVQRLALALVYLLLVGFLGSYALRGALIARDYHRSGIGYTAPSWREAAIIAAASELPAGTALISNETTALMFLVERPAYALQEIYQDTPQTAFTVYGAGSDEAQRVFREEGGALVLFNANLKDDFAMYGEQVDERLSALTRGLRIHYQGEDGTIYFYK